MLTTARPDLCTVLPRFPEPDATTSVTETVHTSDIEQTDQNEFKRSRSVHHWHSLTLSAGES